MRDLSQSEIDELAMELEHLKMLEAIGELSEEQKERLKELRKRANEIGLY